MNRREFLASPLALAARDAKPDRQFRRRVCLGWITDLASRPEPGVSWPSLRLDEELLADYHRSLRVLANLGFNAISVWGLYVARNWPVPIERAVEPERGRRVERLIADAHRRGLKVYAGLGVYSWGFEEIIRQFPELNRGNPRALCASDPKAWEWMRRVTDYVFSRFRIDGVSMQSADQGRCTCSECRGHTDAEYHALLVSRMGDYIRERQPGKIVAANSWGLRFGDAASLPSLVRMGRKLDYLIDVHDTSRSADPAYRRRLIKALACDFGTLGGPQVEPPQHWPRDRWFLPCVKRAGEHLEALQSDAGRACEFFFHILENPGDEVSLWVAGKVLSDPSTAWQAHLKEVAAELYETSRSSSADALAELFAAAEDAYFKHLRPGICGTISLEPLESDRAGPPVYLDRLDARQRGQYLEDLWSVRRGFARLAPEIRNQAKMRKILRCIDNTVLDIQRT